MKHLTWLLSGSTFALALLASCESTRQASDTSTSTTTTPTVESRRGTIDAGMEKNGIRLTPYNDSPKYPEATLQLTSPVANSTVPSGPVAFNYDVQGFLLTKMSSGPHMGEMANSMQGQHIHNIVDNQPYTAHYETKFSKPLGDGPHVVLSFLSRSYHESLKHRGAYDLRVVNVGNGQSTAPPIDITQPSLFYSRPKDTYKGNDTKRVLLDFYLVNTTLSPDGNKVRATINGTEFLLDEWQPYQMEGLPAGENTIKLELLDGSGKVMPGAYNSVTRTFTLAP